MSTLRKLDVVLAAAVVLSAITSVAEGGIFARLFQGKACGIPREVLLEIAAPGSANTKEGLGYMEDSSARGTDNNAQLRAAAGITYLGQFLSHDMAEFDPADFSNAKRRKFSRVIKNRASPFLDLDTLYFHAGTRHPMDPSNRAKLLIGNDANPNDWARNSDNRARIADKRNDEHIIISQLSALFVRMHNKFVDEIESMLSRKRWSPRRKFRVAQLHVQRHWQSIVLTDFLPLVVTADVIASVRETGRKWFVGQPFRRRQIPLEFAVGTNRLGHSIGRGRYALNGKQISSDGSPKRFRIFPLNEEEAKPENNLLGGRTVTPEFVIEWNRFFNFSDSTIGDIANDTDQFAGLQVYRRIDRLYARPLMRLPVRDRSNSIGLPVNTIGGANNTVAGVNVVSLAQLDLLRGLSVGLPCGVDIAKKFVGSQVLQLDDFDLFKPKVEDGAALPEGTVDDVPFLLYVLQEGRTQTEGERLGAFGGRLQAEVILGMLEADRRSILNVPGGKWTSFITGKSDFSMVDLIQYVEGDLDPVDIRKI